MSACAKIAKGPSSAKQTFLGNFLRRHLTSELTKICFSSNTAYAYYYRDSSAYCSRYKTRKSHLLLLN